MKLGFSGFEELDKLHSDFLNIIGNFFPNM